MTDKEITLDVDSIPRIQLDEDDNSEDDKLEDSVPKIYRQISQSITTLNLDELNKKLSEQLGADIIHSDVNKAVMDLCIRIQLLSDRWLVISNRYKYSYSFFTFLIVATNAISAVLGYNEGNLISAILNSTITVLVIFISIFKLSSNSTVYGSGAQDVIKIRRIVGQRLIELNRQGRVSESDLFREISLYQNQIDDLEFNVSTASQISHTI